MKWTFYLLEWRFEHTPLLFRALFAPLAPLAMASVAILFLDVVLIRRFMGWARPFCVVGLPIERTLQKW